MKQGGVVKGLEGKNFFSKDQGILHLDYFLPYVC